MLGQYTLDIERILPHILLVSHMVTWTIMVGLLQVGSALGNQRSVAWRSRALSSDWRAGRPGQISAPRRVVYCRVVCTPMVVEVGRMFVGISSMRNMVGHQTTELAKPPRSAFEMCSCASSARREPRAGHVRRSAHTTEEARRGSAAAIRHMHAAWPSAARLFCKPALPELRTRAHGLP